jgi:hypothetical protein
MGAGDMTDSGTGGSLGGGPGGSPGGGPGWSTSSGGRPYDSDRVQAAIRLGWVVAEVRGRNRPGGPTGTVLSLPDPIDDPLPLRVQRTPTELRIEAQRVLTYLAARLEVDTRPGRSGYGEAIDEAAGALARTRKVSAEGSDQVRSAWEALAALLWKFDGDVQDRLTAVSDTQANGYQLGRGLAECYWALDLESAEGWDSWAFLFDQVRCAELTRLAGRLSPYMQNFSASSIAGSLEVWKRLSVDERWRCQPGVQEDLYQQIRNWYELMVLNQDPTQLVRPYHMLQSWRATNQALKAFIPELVVAAVSALLLVGFIIALSQKHPVGWLAAITSVLGAVGLSGAGVTAWLRSEAQALSTRLRQDAYTDLIAAAITTVPDPPPERHRRGREAVVEEAVGARTLTPSTPLS